MDKDNNINLTILNEINKAAKWEWILFRTY